MTPANVTLKSQTSISQGRFSRICGRRLCRAHMAHNNFSLCTWIYLSVSSYHEEGPELQYVLDNHLSTIHLDFIMAVTYLVTCCLMQHKKPYKRKGHKGGQVIKKLQKKLFQ